MTIKHLFAVLIKDALNILMINAFIKMWHFRTPSVLSRWGYLVCHIDVGADTYEPPVQLKEDELSTQGQRSGEARSLTSRHRSDRVMGAQRVRGLISEEEGLVQSMRHSGVAGRVGTSFCKQHHSPSQKFK